MTADLYATATGLIGRSAAAFVSGVPEEAVDDGFFGPASVAWRVSADLASPVAGLRYSAPPLSPGRRTEIRQSLGVLDALFLGQPGVLEARQRITLRMRAGGPA
jgi:hypothetical protein